MDGRRVKRTEFWVEQRPAPTEFRKLSSELGALMRDQRADMARDRSLSLPVKPNKFRQHRRKA